MEFVQRHLEDVGTRYDHLQELKSEWEAGIQIISKYQYLSKPNLERLALLQFGVRMLELTVNGLSKYPDSTLNLSRQINEAHREAKEMDLTPYD